MRNGHAERPVVGKKKNIYIIICILKQIRNVRFSQRYFYKIHVLWNVTPYRRVSTSRRFGIAVTSYSEPSRPGLKMMSLVSLETSRLRYLMAQRNFQEHLDLNQNTSSDKQGMHVEVDQNYTEQNVW